MQDAKRSCPLHPAVVHLPVVFYPLAAVLRFLGTQPSMAARLPGLDSRSLFAGAHYLNLAALATSIPAAITGYMEYRKIDPRETESRRLVHKHIALNTVVTLLGLLNFLALRNVTGFRPSGFHVIIGIIGALLLAYSGHIGGKLAFEHGIGARA